jgi:hypothetical protein
MTDAPVAPWTLTGESLVAVARCPVGLGTTPPGVHRLPFGPTLIVAVRYSGSPVGPYLELAIGEPARLGARPGWCFTTMVVDSPASRLGGRANWGFPKEVGSLVWSEDGDERSLRWVERGVTVRGVPGRFALPALVPVRALQRRADGPVVVPGRLRGRAHLARVSVEVGAADDPLAPLVGEHRGVHVTSMRFVVRPARSPVGFTSSLRAPLRAPLPAPAPYRSEAAA